MATVRTPEGETRFKKPIGSPLDDSPSEEMPRAVAPAASPLRLRALRATILDKMRVGDTAAVRMLTEKFRAEYQRFAADKTPEQIDRALNKAA